MSSSDVVIEVQDVSKCYQLYESARDRLKQFLLPRVRRIARLPPQEHFREFWALRDVSFQVRRGETVGILGRNGSGKSTLLQLICGTLTPTRGQVQTRGRLAALLELGSGFNPEFTGKENVYLNGSILGLTKREIDARYEDIIAFADIGDFVEQPVKTYSSGMLVRLAFAVQVQIEPDILVVDEALAVGDALFQKRCFQQMEKLVANGTTLLFVSHDQESVRTLTSRALLLSSGKIVARGTSSEVLLEYRRQLHEEERRYLDRMLRSQRIGEPRKTTTAYKRSDRLSFGDRDAEVRDVRVLDTEGVERSYFYPGEVIKIAVTCLVYKRLEHANISLRIRNKEGVKMYSWGTLNQDISIWSGLEDGPIFWDRCFLPGEEVTVVFECKCVLGVNLYEVQAAITEEEDRYYGAQRILHWRDEAAFFQVSMKQKEYFFGGVCDLRMKVAVRG